MCKKNIHCVHYLYVFLQSAILAKHYLCVFLQSAILAEIDCYHQSNYIIPIVINVKIPSIVINYIL